MKLIGSLKHIKTKYEWWELHKKGRVADMSKHDNIVFKKILVGEIDIAELLYQYRVQNPSTYIAALRRYRYFRHDSDCEKYVQILNILLDDIRRLQKSGQSTELLSEIYTYKCWDSVKNIGYPNLKSLSPAALKQLCAKNMDALKEICHIDAKYIIPFGESHRTP